MSRFGNMQSSLDRRDSTESGSYSAEMRACSLRIQQTFPFSADAQPMLNRCCFCYCFPFRLTRSIRPHHRHIPVSTPLIEFPEMGCTSFCTVLLSLIRCERSSLLLPLQVQGASSQVLIFTHFGPGFWR